MNTEQQVGASSRSRRWVWTAVIIVAVIVVIAAVWQWLSAAQARAAQRQQVQQLMGLTPLNSPSRPAPDFHLTDQRGQTISLDQFKGKVVVLEFMDPKCTDICPIVSSELVQANGLLGTKASGVVYLGVNVNQYHESQADIEAFSQEHGLSRLPNWHFLTGSTPQLKAVWQAYGIQVIPNRKGDVQHSSYMYFISKDGKEAFVADPDNNKSTIAQWANGIRYVVSSLS